MDRRLYFPRLVVDARANRWDWALLPLVLGTLVLLAYGGAQMARPFQVGDPLPLSLDPVHLPYYLLRTQLRMGMAMILALVFSAVYAVIAAKVRAAEKVLVPMLDILQSIPILGFLTITVTGFIALFPGNLFGVECASIFAIFTSQAWNMAFSLYQSLRAVPAELDEAARIFQLTGWQRFWRLELPFAMPGLLWNMMMSMSGGWFFVVASEAIAVSNQSIRLPGVGSYIAMAIEARDLHAVGWAILAMLAGILIYDQLLFRPLVAWAGKFRFEDGATAPAARSWMLDGLRRTALMQRLGRWMVDRLEQSLLWFPRRQEDAGTRAPARLAVLPPRARQCAATALVAVLAAGSLWHLFHFVHAEVGWREAGHVMLLGGMTLVRVLALTVLAALVWVPVGLWVGMNPRWSGRLQVVAQFMAAFPANLLFPLAVIGIARWGLDPDVWLSPLMIFGTQWYLLFNVIAGASTIPADLRHAADNLGLRGWMRWRRFLLPAVFPSIVTGAITASGGSWNASIVAEYVSWGSTTLQARGLGSYIAQMTAQGDFPRIALGIGVMCLFVMALNHFVWQPLYRRAGDRTA